MLQKGEEEMEKFKKVVSIILLIILIPILLVSTIILINSFLKPNEVPSFFGWKPFIVLSGSMETQIMTGDVAVVKEVDTAILKEGDVIAFKDGEVVITHRIERIEQVDGQTRYITKGDNNNTEDKGYVLPEQVEGLYQFRVARLGNLAMFIQTPIGMVVCISIPLIMLALLQLSDSRKEKKIIRAKENRQRQMEEEMEKLRKQNEELAKK